MSDSLQAAAALVDRLGPAMATALPEPEPVIDCGALAAHRMELRQVAGMAAGGTLELSPGHWDFGPVADGPGRLQGGDPDRVGFTLAVGADLAVTVGPGDGPVLLDDQPVHGPTEVGGRVINAGSARFVVARPRPPRKRDGGIAGDGPAATLDEWVVDPVPRPATVGPDLGRLIAQRRRLHHGPDETRHRIEGGGPLLWDRTPDHPLFGTSVVGVADVPLRGAGVEVSVPVPVSVDLVGRSTVVVGRRSHQLAVVRNLVLGLAATVDPADLRIGLHSELPELAFLRDLPHATEVRSGVGGPRRRTLLVVDRGRDDRTVGSRRPTRDRWPILPGGGAMLILGRRHDPIPEGADVVTIVDECHLSVHEATSGRVIRRSTPVGLGAALSADLADLLRSARR